MAVDFSVIRITREVPATVNALKRIMAESIILVVRAAISLVQTAIHHVTIMKEGISRVILRQMAGTSVASIRAVGISAVKTVKIMVQVVMTVLGTIITVPVAIGRKMKRMAVDFSVVQEDISEVKADIPHVRVDTSSALEGISGISLAEARCISVPEIVLCHVRSV